MSALATIIITHNTKKAQNKSSVLKIFCKEKELSKSKFLNDSISKNLLPDSLFYKL